MGRLPATLEDQASGRAPAATPAQPATFASAAALPRPSGLGARPADNPVNAATAGPFHVQIGAFSNEAEAQKQLATVSQRASALLSGHAPFTVPVAKANAQFYRARFAGFNEAGALAVCQSLKAQKIECAVMRAE